MFGMFRYRHGLRHCSFSVMAARFFVRYLPVRLRAGIVIDEGRRARRVVGPKICALVIVVCILVVYHVEWVVPWVLDVEWVNKVICVVQVSRNTWLSRVRLLRVPIRSIFPRLPTSGLATCCVIYVTPKRVFIFSLFKPVVVVYRVSGRVTVVWMPSTILNVTVRSYIVFVISVVSHIILIVIVVPSSVWTRVVRIVIIGASVL